MYETNRKHFESCQLGLQHSTDLSLSSTEKFKSSFNFIPISKHINGNLSHNHVYCPLNS